MPILKTELTSMVEKLRAMEAEVSKLQTAIVEQRPAELAGLHVAYGFETVDSFVKAVKEAAAKAPKGKIRGRKAAAAKVAAASKPAGKPGRPRKDKKAKPAKRTRARITDEVRQQVIALANEGKSGIEIASITGVSVPSVQNIKKDAGLVKTRGAKPAAPAPVAVAPAPVADAPAPMGEVPPVIQGDPSSN